MQTTQQMLDLAFRADSGYGWVILMSVACCLTYGGLRSVFPGISRLALPFPKSVLPSGDFVPWLIGLGGLVLRMPHLFESLWYDETFTAAFSLLPLDKLFTAVMGDVHPPLPYLMTWLIARLIGASEAALRLPSLAFGMLLIYLMYRLTRGLHLSRNTALLAAGLVAAMPGAMYYSAEARGYSMLACLVIISTIAILEHRPGWFILAALIPWTHNTGYIYLGLLGLGALLYHPHRRWLRSIVIAGLIGAAWLPFMLQQAGDIQDGFWIPPLTAPGALWYVMTDTAGVNMPDWFVLPVYVPLWAVTLLALWHSRRWLLTRRGLLFLGLCFGAPALLSLASWLWKPVYVARALLPSGVALGILWAIYIQRSKNGWWMTSLSLGLSVIGFFTPVAAKVNIDAYLRSCQPADTAYYTDVVGWFYGNYYIHKPALVWNGANDLNQSLPQTTKQVLFRQGDDNDLRGRVCLVRVDTPYSSPEERAHVAQVLARFPHETQLTEINGVFYLYVYLLEAG